MEYSNKINDSNTVVLVDDGATSGATLIVSAQWIKKEERISIQKIDNVIPVAPKETPSLSSSTNRVLCGSFFFLDVLLHLLLKYFP
jgi:predicted phosphoribosyltransferase